MADIANTAQRDYWNQVAGPRWVGLEGAVERRMTAINELLLARAAPRPGERILEIGCGTGASTVPFAAAVLPQGRVVGADISEAMLGRARQRVAESGLGNITLTLADAQTQDFEPGAFDLIASRFGVMFFADPRAAFTNLIGALRPGGRLCFICWGTLADNRHWLLPFEIAVRHVGRPQPGNPRAPGPMAFADPDYVRDFLAAAGFTSIDITREHPAVGGLSITEETELGCSMGPVARLLDEKNPDEATRQAIRGEIAAAITAIAEGGTVYLPSTVNVVTARRPG